VVYKGASDGRRVAFDVTVAVEVVELTLEPRRSEGWARLGLLDELADEESGYSKGPFSAAGVPKKSALFAGHEPNLKSSRGVSSSIK